MISVKTVNGVVHQFHDIKAVLFDLDGTLIDTLDLHIKSFQWILKKLGKSIAQAELENLMGRTPHDIINYFFQGMSQSEVWEAANQKEKYLESLVEHVYRYDGSIELLKTLRKHKIKSVVISSTYRKLVEILLEKAGLLEYIDEIVSGDEVRTGKPDPEPFLMGVRKLKTNAENCIGIGDSVHDLQSCSRAGVTFIGVLTGKTSIEEFEKIECKMIIEGLNEIIPT